MDSFSRSAFQAIAGESGGQHAGAWNFVAVVIQTCKRAVFHVYGRSLFARDGILCEEKHLLATRYRNCARAAWKAEVLLVIHILACPSQQLG